MPMVLLVDDDSDNRSMLSIRLQRMGHQVLPAASAVEALHLLDEHPIPDVAVLDIVMKGITGLELLEHLRRDRAYALMPAILMTARELHTDAFQTHGLGAGLLKKPVLRADLTAAIAQAQQLATNLQPGTRRAT